MSNINNRRAAGLLSTVILTLPAAALRHIADVRENLPVVSGLSEEDRSEQLYQMQNRMVDAIGAELVKYVEQIIANPGEVNALDEVTVGLVEQVNELRAKGELNEDDEVSTAVIVADVLLDRAVNFIFETEIQSKMGEMLSGLTGE